MRLSIVYVLFYDGVKEQRVPNVFSCVPGNRAYCVFSVWKVDMYVSFLKDFQFKYAGAKLEFFFQITNGLINGFD